MRALRGTRGRWVGAACVAAASVAIAYGVAGEGTVEVISPVGFGYNEIWTRSLASTSPPALAKEGGATLARVGVDWGQVQPTSHSRENWRTPDQQIDAVTSQGLRPLIVVVGAPSDYGQSCGAGRIVTDDQNTVLPAYSRFVADTINRYYEFNGVRAQGIEIWNEPNSQKFWGGCAPDPVRYARLFAYASFGAARSSHPGISMVLGAPAPKTNTNSDQIEWESWIHHVVYAGAQFYSTFAEHVDAIALHPYRTAAQASNGKTPAQAAVLQYQDAKALIGAMNVGGFSMLGTPIWVTEVGVQDNDPSLPGPYEDPHDYPPNTDMDTVLGNDLQQIYADLRLAGAPVITMYRLMDDDSSSETFDRSFGVVHRDRDGSIHCKPGYFLLAEDRGESPSCP